MAKVKKCENLCIDTNIYLDYFRMSSERIDSLKQLLKLIKDGKINLLLPQQIKDEYLRKNKKKFIESSRNQELAEIEGSISKPKIKEIPKSLENLPEAKEIQKNNANFLKSFDSLKNKVCEKYNEISKNQSKIEKLIEDVLEKAENVNDKEEIIRKAFFRFTKGNPPRKRKDDEKYGDAIIWETILDRFINAEEDLTLITRDSDFDNEFLHREWNKKIKKSKISIENYLSSFINKVSEKSVIKKPAVEEEKNLPPTQYFAPINGFNSVLGNPYISADGMAYMQGIHGTSYGVLDGNIVPQGLGIDLGGGIIASPVSNMDLYKSASVLEFKKCRNCERPCSSYAGAIDDGLCETCRILNRK